MNTKKWIALLLALLTAFAMVGCGGGNNVDQPIDIGPVETPAPTEAPDSGLGLAQAEAPIGMVAAGSVHTVGLRADGTAVSAGHDTVGQRKVSDWENVTFLAAGELFTAGVKADGTLLLAGDNTALADSASWEAAAAWTGLHSVAIGKAHMAGLKTDGTVVAAGDTASGQCEVTGWSDIVAIAAGDTFTVGLTSAGTLVTAGAAPDVSAWKDVVSVSAGGDVIAALTKDGTALVSNGADVSAHVQRVAVRADFRQMRRRLFRGVALPHGAHINGRLRVGQPHGSVLLVDLQQRNVRMLRRSCQLLRRRHARRRRIVARRRPAVVPDGQDRAQHHIHFAVRFVVQLFGIVQKRNQLFIDRNRFSARQAVDGTEIVDAGIFMVNVEELVILFQNAGNFGRTLFKLFCRIPCIAENIGDGIEICEIALPPMLIFGRRAGAARKEQRQRQHTQQNASGLFHPIQYRSLLCFVFRFILRKLQPAQ